MIRPLENVARHEREFIRLVRAYGRSAPPGKRIALAPVGDDGETDCWTHAWDLARDLGALYVEGICRRDGAGGPSMHAWVEESTPLGPRVVEVTPGYERATAYRGLAIDCRPGSDNDRLTRGWNPRVSVLQAAIAGLPAGRAGEEALAAVAEWPGAVL